MLSGNKKFIARRRMRNVLYLLFFASLSCASCSRHQDKNFAQETEYKEFKYTPNLKRPISIIDPETTEEVKPILYFDEETNEVKGKCKLKPYKNYFAFEIRDLTDESVKVVGGNPVLEN